MTTHAGERPSSTTAGAENLCNVQGEDDRLGIVHRLDRDTSGLMLAAKNDETGYALMSDIRDRASTDVTWRSCTA